MRKIFRIASVVCCAALYACSSGSTSAKKPDSGGGIRVLEAVVVEREKQTSYSGTLSYYMGFEAKDGEATAHMRYEVTRDQFMRYQEGSHVRLYLSDDRLRDIKSGDASN